MPGAQCARSLAGQKKQALPVVTVTTVTPESPGIPRTMVYGLLRALPGDRAFLSPSSAKVAFSKLDDGVEASGPHDFAVRAGAIRLLAPHASTASRRALMTLRNAPLWAGRSRYELIWSFRKSE